MGASDNGQAIPPRSPLGEVAIECFEDSERWFGDQPIHNSIPYTVLCMAGEVGELANLIKKIERGDLTAKDAKVHMELVMEATDVFTYLMLLYALLGVDPLHAYNMKRVENEQRFPAARKKREGAKRNEPGPRVPTDNHQA